MKRLLASLLLPAALAAHAQIATGSATVAMSGEISVFPEQQVLPAGSPGLVQIRNGDKNTRRRELGPVMGFIGGAANSVCSYTSPLDGVTTTWTEKDTWTYTGEMYMTAGVTYTFASLVDDYSTISIDGDVVLTQRGCTFTTGSLACTESGWHTIVVKVWDAGGGYGNNRNFTPGIAYNMAGQTAQSYSGWVQLVDPGDGSLLRTNQAIQYEGVRVVAQMRESDPTVMDVDYIVYTDPETTPTVNVRALAFEDGERGFATVVRPETFIEGTDANIGDGIAANVAHRLSWKVSSDWATDLAKVSFEVMAMKPGDLLLPDMHFVTIPAAEGHPKTIVSVNDMTVDAYEITRDENYYNGVYRQWGWVSDSSLIASRIVGNQSLLNALFWLYASGDSELTLSDGVLKKGTLALVRHAGFLSNWAYDGINYNHKYKDEGCWSLNPNAIRYVFGKMGYRLLDDPVELAWVNENTRLNLQPQQFRQYAVKTVE